MAIDTYQCQSQVVSNLRASNLDDMEASQHATPENINQCSESIQSKSNEELTNSCLQLTLSPFSNSLGKRSLPKPFEESPNKRRRSGRGLPVQNPGFEGNASAILNTHRQVIRTLSTISQLITKAHQVEKDSVSIVESTTGQPTSLISLEEIKSIEESIYSKMSRAGTLRQESATGLLQAY